MSYLLNDDGDDDVGVVVLYHRQLFGVYVRFLERDRYLKSEVLV